MTYPVSRRSFLATSAAAAGRPCSTCSPRLRRRHDYYGGLPIGIQSYSLRNFKTDEAIRHVQGLGLHYVEFFGAHFSPAASPEQIDGDEEDARPRPRSWLNAHGVHNFTKDHEANKKLFDFAKAPASATSRPIPARRIRSTASTSWWPNTTCGSPSTTTAPGALYDKVGNVVDGDQGARQANRRLRRFRALPPQWRGPRRVRPRPRDRVYGVHIKDVDNRSRRPAHVVLGKGHLDVVGLFKSSADRSISRPTAPCRSNTKPTPTTPIDDIALPGSREGSDRQRRQLTAS